MTSIKQNTLLLHTYNVTDRYYHNMRRKERRDLGTTEYNYLFNLVVKCDTHT